MHLKIVGIALAGLALASCGGNTNHESNEGGCRDSIPKAQLPSAACCSDWGIDACGAGLFCAAFDGRTQPVCYVEKSRADGETCTENRQCFGGSCSASEGICAPDCQARCEEKKACANASEELRSTDCQASCTSGRSGAITSSCVPAYDAYLSCDAKVAACAAIASNACSSEAVSLVGCMAAYCSGNPTAELCKSP
ncbi:MAG: hypothetical protein HY901_28030 [Deltaproteobacteria bacterium]|nr:hypothetical protein [Deltaproteobacteria bacterium]